MNLKHVFAASTAAFLMLASGAAEAGQTISDVGAMACVSRSGIGQALEEAGRYDDNVFCLEEVI